MLIRFIHSRHGMIGALELDVGDYGFEVIMLVFTLCSLADVI